MFMYKRIDHFKEWLAILQERDDSSKITPEIEAKLCDMFIAIQKPFKKYCDHQGHKISFPSYAYIIIRFLQLLGEKQCLSDIVLTKTADKLKRQDEIFQFICEELGWSN